MSVFQRCIPILPVRSMARAMDFYRALGWTTSVYDGTEGYAFVTHDQLEIHLRHEPDLVEAENPSGSYFILEPGTAAGLEQRFRAAGVSILSSTEARAWKMIEFMVSDPDGNLLRFGERVADLIG